MNKFHRIILAAIVAVALVLTISCSSDSGGGGGGGDSSSLYGSSSSVYVTPKCGGTEYNPKTHLCDTRDNRIYKWVNIDTQNWMAENLDYETITGSWCYENEVANCAKYGKLYGWTTAMALDISCNSKSCADLIQSKHRGICPENWHIPSDEEWSVLTDFVGKYAPDYKATSGWDNGDGTDNGGGTDKYGFSALPGGRGSINGGTFGDLFGNATYDGYWWSATEADDSNIWRRAIIFGSVGSMQRDKYNKGHNTFSVRCLHDSLYLMKKCGDKEYDPSTHICSNNIVKVGSKCGTRNEFFDQDLYECKLENTYYKIYLKGGFAYENQTYKAVLIGNQTWMAENLNYRTPDGSSRCYHNTANDDDNAYCITYGRLYNWFTAKVGGDVCPEGWHMPGNSEWEQLVSFVEKDKGCTNCAGKLLKAESEWDTSGYTGTDAFGFSALPGGFRYDYGVFSSAVTNGFWWGSGPGAYRWGISSLTEVISSSSFNSSYSFSVRCLKD